MLHSTLKAETLTQHKADPRSVFSPCEIIPAVFTEDSGKVLMSTASALVMMDRLTGGYRHQHLFICFNILLLGLGSIKAHISLTSPRDPPLSY